MKEPEIPPKPRQPHVNMINVWINAFVTITSFWIGYFNPEVTENDGGMYVHCLVTEPNLYCELMHPYSGEELDSDQIDATARMLYLFKYYFYIAGFKTFVLFMSF